MPKNFRPEEQDIRRRIDETLRTLPKDGPEPLFLIIDRTHFQILLDSLQEASKAPNHKEVNRELAEIIAFTNKLVRESSSLSLEEKEELMEGLLKKRESGPTT